MRCDLTTRVGEVVLANPVMNASGCGGYGPELEPFGLERILGAVVSKGLSHGPSQGAGGVRVAETPCGMLNAIGLQNVGYAAFAEKVLPWLRRNGLPYVANCFGDSDAGYLRVVEDLSGHPEIVALELNVSCPNVDAGGSHVGKSPGRLRALVGKVRQVTRKPLWVKLPPDTRDVVEIARAAASAGADALTVANTIPAMVIDVAASRPLLGRASGGLSGPAIHPVALKMVWDVAGAVDLPIVACGGIDSAEAAIAMILAGASAVQIGTMLMADPAVPGGVIDGIREWMAARGYGRIEEFRGTGRRV